MKIQITTYTANQGGVIRLKAETQAEEYQIKEIIEGCKALKMQIIDSGKTMQLEWVELKIEAAYSK